MTHIYNKAMMIIRILKVMLSRFDPIKYIRPISPNTITANMDNGIANVNNEMKIKIPIINSIFFGKFSFNLPFIIIIA